MDKTTLILGIIIGAVCMYFLLHLLWHLGYYVFLAIISFIRRSDGAADLHPRTASNMEAMELPLVRKEFPDFDLEGTKNEIRAHLQKTYGSRPGFQISQVVLNDYRREKEKRQLVFHASVHWQGKKTVHRRIDVLLETILPEKPADAVCPGCGAALSPSDRFCSFCGMERPESPKPQWKLTKVREI